MSSGEYENPAERPAPSGDLAGQYADYPGPPDDAVFLDRADLPFSVRLFTLAWLRKGPIIMSVFIILLISGVFAPWAFVRVEIVGISIVSRTFSGWDIYIARVLFFLLLIPLLISLMMVAGIGTRRRVLETHIITFFLGLMFVVWGGTYGLSKLLESLITRVDVIQVVPADAQIMTFFFLLGLLAGIVITTWDRGRQLIAMGEGG